MALFLRIQLTFSSSSEPWDEEQWKRVIEMRLKDVSRCFLYFVLGRLWARMQLLA
jgi:hypothetical protein